MRVAIIQARMGSTRLPGKILLEIAGDTMLARVVGRVRRARLLDTIVVATSNLAADDLVVAECDRLGVRCVRGSETDVLARYALAASAVQAEVIVRITSDCPLIDPEVLDYVLAAFLAERPDYASNCLERTFPRGLDVEVFSRRALAMAHMEAREGYEREHVTPYIYENPEQFQLLLITSPRAESAVRWTVDEKEDLELVRRIYTHFRGQDTFGWLQILDLIHDEPELALINAAIHQKSLH
jgi:spore coat polysaccharide biosynthesis protein SpsF